MRTETATKKITQSGDSLVINVTKEVKRLGLGRGDVVEMSLTAGGPDTDIFVNWVVDNALSELDRDSETGAYFIDDPNKPYQVLDVIEHATDDRYSPCLINPTTLGVYRWLEDNTTVQLRQVSFILEDSQ